MLTLVIGKTASKPIFRFKGCLNTPRTPFRSSRRYSRGLSPSTDALSLISLFDRPSPGTTTGINTSGLFGHASLTSPDAFNILADATILRARLLTDRILRARDSRDELTKVVKNLDRLSVLLCGVIDLAEFIRNAHPDPAWLTSANDAYEKLCEFMNTLNTNVGLYEVLRAVFNDTELINSLNPEALEAALIFWRDFEKSAINLPTEQRKQFVKLSSEISILGRQFLKQTNAARPPVLIQASELHGMKDSNMGAQLHSQAEHTLRALKIYPGSLQAHMIMRSVPAESPRQKVYVATNTSSSEQLDILERLLKTRARLARLAGKDSYAAITLTNKMAKSPDNVQHFLDALLEYTRPQAKSALQTLATRKQTHLSLSEVPIINAWDRDFYCPPEPPAPPVPLPPLTLGTVFMALSRLFQHLYGVSLRPASMAPGETWHSTVRKLEVVDEDNGVIGWIYPDLFVRHGKASGAAHYTVCCSRRTDLDDTALDKTLEGKESLLDISHRFEADQRRHVKGQPGLYQLPVVVLMCEFMKPTSKTGPTILEWHEVVTLFHEMGHAMHSMIGRTEYHNVAGTRCATDFVELPSILMEHFLNSPLVLSLFHVDGRPPLQRSGNHHEDPCRSIDTHSQILLALLDQEYHSTDVLAPDFNSTQTVERLHNSRGLIPFVPGTSFQTKFGHLYGYGATYYSYLFDRAIASRVWNKVFAHDPLSRETGEKYKREILRHGGGKDPWLMIASLLDAPELEVGDASAMREVGRWRIEDDVSLPQRH